MNVINVKNLTKQIKKNTIINDLSLTIEKGEIYGFLGANGAGKTTTMKMLLGLLQPSAGSIEIFSKPLKGNKNEILANIGSLIEEPSYYDHLTGYENLEIVRRLLNLPKKNIEEVLNIVRLTKQKDKLVKHYSLGMKQRLGIALALVNFPKLLILDEPTNGLDPAGIQEMRELIKSLPRKYGMTVMISSHLLSEIQQMATTVGIIHSGKLLFEGNIHELEEEQGLRIEVGNIAKAMQILAKESLHVYCQDQPSSLLLPTLPKNKVSQIVKSLVQADINVYQVSTMKKPLEETFLEMTAKGGVL